jgi:hypothetical protein
MTKSYSLSQIINKALFDKEKGYYRNKNPLGKNGDFITSPEISQIFGEVILNYLLYIFSEKKPKLSLVEIGAGRGFLFSDILKSLNNLVKKNHTLALDFISKASFHIVEINPVLIDIAHKNLQDLSSIFKIKWHENFDDFLLAKQGEIYQFSNEFFDCFPIDQFVKTKQGWCERVMSFEDYDKFSNPQIFTANFTSQIDQFVKNQLPINSQSKAKINAVFEYSKEARSFMNQLSQSLHQHGGISINCDYGYYDYDFANTLQGMKNHQKIDFIDSLSGCDITSHVDFAALKAIADNFGLECQTLSQGEFLRSFGIEERAAILKSKNPDLADEIDCALQRLIGTSKNQMGELFKCQILKNCL